MDGLVRKMPSTIDYSDVLPMSVPAVSRRRKFFPTNGGEFRAEGNSEIRIPIDSTTALLDPAHSYLQFTIQNFDPAVTLSLDAGGAAMFFSRVRVEQQGKVLSDTAEYNRLVASVINPCTETAGGRLAGSIRDSTIAGQIDGAANNAPYVPASNRGDRRAFCVHGDGTKIAVGGSYTFTMPLLTGLFTQDKLIPLPLVDKSNPITIVLNLETEENLGVWAGGGGAAPGVQAIAIMQVCYNAQLVEVGGDVINQFSMMRDMMGGQLALSGQDWEHSAFFLDAAGGGAQRVVNLPVRKRSIKSLFWVANSDTLANTPGPLAKHQVYNKSFGGHCNVDSWQIKVGSVTYPPTPIEGPGNGALHPSQNARGECLKELSKAMGTLSFVNPTGSMINSFTYFTDQRSTNVGAATSNGDNGTGGIGPLTLIGEATDPTYVAAFGIDLESFQHTAIESGVDSETMALDTNLLLNINSAAGNIGIEDKTIHSWFCYDKHYYFNRDGSVTMSD